MYLFVTFDQFNVSLRSQLIFAKCKLVKILLIAEFLYDKSPFTSIISIKIRVNNYAELLNAY